MVSRRVGSCVSAATVIRMIKYFPVVDSRITSGVIGGDDWALKMGGPMVQFWWTCTRTRLSTYGKAVVPRHWKLGLNSTQKCIPWPGTEHRLMPQASARVLLRPAKLQTGFICWLTSGKPWKGRHNGLVKQSNQVLPGLYALAIVILHRNFVFRY
jgi:hypothetical protein